MVKKAVSVLLLVVVTICTGISCTKDKVIQQFDLSDTKEYYTGAAEDLSTNEVGVLCDKRTVYITFRKTKSYPQLTVEALDLPKEIYTQIAHMQYLYRKPELLNAQHWETHDKDDFRQSAWIRFESELSSDELLQAIKALEQSAVIKSVKPLFPATCTLDEDLKEKIEFCLASDEERVEEYLGTYGRASAVLLSGEYAAVLSSDGAAGVMLVTPSPQKILVFYNETFYRLEDAYKQNLLKTEDVFQILYRYSRTHYVSPAP